MYGKNGNRMATWLIYVSSKCYKFFYQLNVDKYINDRFIIQMSDVEVGGATIFPQINVSIPPQKGSAAFWYNLHPSGERDESAPHSGCPVLLGSKWGECIFSIMSFQFSFLY